MVLRWDRRGGGLSTLGGAYELVIVLLQVGGWVRDPPGSCLTNRSVVSLVLRFRVDTKLGAHKEICTTKGSLATLEIFI